MPLYESLIHVVAQDQECQLSLSYLELHFVGDHRLEVHRTRQKGATV